MAVDRITLNLDEQSNRLLVSARARDAVPSTDRFRAGLQLWRDDPAVRDRINRAAEELRQNRLSTTSQERPVKVTVILGIPLHRDLVFERATDGIPTTERLRAVVHLWRTDPELRARIDRLAGELRRRRFPRPTAAGDTSPLPPSSTAPLRRTTRV